MYNLYPIARKKFLLVCSIPTKHILLIIMQVHVTFVTCKGSFQRDAIGILILS